MLAAISRFSAGALGRTDLLGQFHRVGAEMVLEVSGQLVPAPPATKDQCVIVYSYRAELFVDASNPASYGVRNVMSTPPFGMLCGA